MRLILLILLSVCYADVIHVPADYSTIQEGIDASIIIDELQGEVFKLKNSIDFIEGLAKIKPQILYNYGRDKKYIYGQVYFKSTPQSTNKKTFRFIIGKMDENKSRKQLEKICVETFYKKIIYEIETI